LNDASCPDGDDDSVNAKIGTPESIEKVPALPENYDEEILSHPTEEEEPSKRLKGKRGHRSSIPIRKSLRLRRAVNMWEALDPTKLKLDQEIDRQV